MSLRVEIMPADRLEAQLDALARLRIEVFRDWPYLYDGDAAYERRYLATYRESADAVVVGAWDGARLVGAATGTPLSDHAEDFARALDGRGIGVAQTFYNAESVLLPAYRGQGVGHRFFDLREAHARDLGCQHAIFASVLRPKTHPLRPASVRSHAAFWRKRGYAPLAGAVAQFAWKDIDCDGETAHDLQIWHRRLDP